MPETATKLEPVFIERFEKAAAAVAGAVSRTFDMGVWKCGSCQCAIAEYCLQNPDAELRLVPSQSDRKYMVPMLQDGNGRVLYAINAVAHHFGIERDAAEWLFTEEAYFGGHEEICDFTGEPARAAVLQRLRAFIAQHK